MAVQGLLLLPFRMPYVYVRLIRYAGPFPGLVSPARGVSVSGPTPVFMSEVFNTHCWELFLRFLIRALMGI